MRPDPMMRSVVRALTAEWGDVTLAEHQVYAWHDGLALTAELHRGRKHLAGRVIVRFGVLVPEAQVFTMEGPPSTPGKSPTSILGCHVLRHLDGCGHPDGGWFRRKGRGLAEPERFEACVRTFAHEIRSRYGTREAIVREWRAHGVLPGSNSSSSAVTAAAIMMGIDDRTGAAEALAVGRRCAEAEDDRIGLDQVMVASAALAALG